MKNFRARVFRHIIKYVDLYFIGSIPPFLTTTFFLYIYCIENIESKLQSVSLDTLYFFCVTSAWFFLMAFIKGRAYDVARYLQDTNENLSEKHFNDIYYIIGELDIETFILLEKKALEYEKEQREIEKSKRKAEREAKEEAEQKAIKEAYLIERRKILKIKKEIGKSI